MSEDRPLPGRPDSKAAAEIDHVVCPACDCPTAVVAAFRYGQQMCFCPACEHVWECRAPKD